MSKYRIPNEFAHRSDGTTVLFLKRRNGDTFECVIDSEDYPKVRPLHWHVYKSKHGIYANAWMQGRAHKLTMHRFLMPGCERVAHLDYNGLNNRRNNLASVTRSQSNRRRRKGGPFTSQYKGVSLAKSCKRFRATISHENKVCHLGYFDSEADAAKRYNTEVVNRFGDELAELNRLPNETPTAA